MKKNESLADQIYRLSVPDYYKDARQLAKIFDKYEKILPLGTRKLILESAAITRNKKTQSKKWSLF